MKGLVSEESAVLWWARGKVTVNMKICSRQFNLIKVSHSKCQLCYHSFYGRNFIINLFDSMQISVWQNSTLYLKIMKTKKNHSTIFHISAKNPAAWQVSCKKNNKINTKLTSHCVCHKILSDIFKDSHAFTTINCMQFFKI